MHRRTDTEHLRRRGSGAERLQGDVLGGLRFDDRVGLWRGEDVEAEVANLD